jgi:type III secretion protein N (ATPase)
MRERVRGVRLGRIVATRGELLEAHLPLARLGETVRVIPAGAEVITASVTRVSKNGATLAAHGALNGVCVGDRVESTATADYLPLGVSLLGRSIDSAGVALDRLDPVRGLPVPVTAPPLGANTRRQIAQPLWTGIRAIDAFTTIGRGARIGIFGAPSAGKTTLLRSIVRGTSADAVVLGLIGERGREAAEWMAGIDARTTIVCAPSDRSAAERVRSAHVALAQACELRRRGLDVLVILDSLARFVSASREIAVASGEPVGRGGYPASVFGELARLVERAGSIGGGGSVTLIATVLVEGGDEREPLVEAAKAVLDGHIVLSNELARSRHFPAIDISASVSRTMDAVVGSRHHASANAVRAAVEALARTREARELSIAVTSPFVAGAVAHEARILAFLRQAADQIESPQRLELELHSIARLLAERRYDVAS